MKDPALKQQQVEALSVLRPTATFDLLRIAQDDELGSLLHILRSFKAIPAERAGVELSDRVIRFMLLQGLRPNASTMQFHGPVVQEFAKFQDAISAAEKGHMWRFRQLVAKNPDETKEWLDVMLAQNTKGTLAQLPFLHPLLGVDHTLQHHVDLLSLKKYAGNERENRRFRSNISQYYQHKVELVAPSLSAPAAPAAQKAAEAKQEYEHACNVIRRYSSPFWNLVKGHWGSHHTKAMREVLKDEASQADKSASAFMGRVRAKVTLPEGEKRKNSRLARKIDYISEQIERNEKIHANLARVTPTR